MDLPQLDVHIRRLGLSDELWIGLVSERSLKGDGSQTTWNAPTSREHTVVPSWSETAERKERAAYAALSFSSELTLLDDCAGNEAVSRR